jgi:hypothetical protein
VTRRGSNAHRSFDPNRVGRLECVTWVTYYRRDWPRFLRAAVSVTRHAFGLSWPAALYASWLVLRANQLWAPPVDNDPDGARQAMRRFYSLLHRRHHETYDPTVAAALEVDWWRIHREHQRHGSELDEQSLIEALAALYSYVYGVPKDAVRMAAEQRALAMRLSDRWVSQGCDLASPLVAQERAALVRSYAALLAAIHLP